MIRTPECLLTIRHFDAASFIQCIVVRQRHALNGHDVSKDLFVILHTAIRATFVRAMMVLVLD